MRKLLLGTTALAAAASIGANAALADVSISMLLSGNIFQEVQILLLLTEQLFQTTMK
jgi:hypothetical protein